MMRAIAAAFLISLGSVSSLVIANEAFTFGVEGEPKTIGDLKPTFVVYKDKPIPDVSVEYVLKRYVRLFEKAQAPDVRVDALNRINNLNAQYGVKSKKLSIDEETQSEVLLDSYNEIASTDVAYDRMDELVYQTAKATAISGGRDSSKKQLKLLVGLYPKSPLADESLFRLAEFQFWEGDYFSAEASYQKLLQFANTDEFRSRAMYMLAWSRYKQDRYRESSKGAFEVLADFPALNNAKSLSVLAEQDAELAEDLFRLAALSLSAEGGVQAADNFLKAGNHGGYAYLLFDAIFRQHLGQERFQDAAQTAAFYASQYASDFYAYQMANNAIRAYELGELDILAWNSKADFVDNFGVESYFWTKLSEAEQARVRPLAENYGSQLAHLNYVRMQQNRDKDPETHREYGRTAAGHYLDLIKLTPDSVDNGPRSFLAAEALREVGDFSQALKLYERAAYSYETHENTEKAAYATVVVYDQWAMNDASGQADLALQKDQRPNILRYAKKYPDNAKTASMLNKVAQDLFAEEDYLQAISLSGVVNASRQSTKQEKYDAILLSANSYFELSKFDAAESFYATALDSPLSKPQSRSLQERLALSIYRQAERATDSNSAAELFLRVVDVVPSSTIVPQALYDASSQQIKAKDWSGAIASLSHFQASFPQNELALDATKKLIYVYEQTEDWISAADKLIELSDRSKDVSEASNALFQSAEYYGNSGLEQNAADIYRQFIQRYPDQFDLAIEAHVQAIAYAESRKDEGYFRWNRDLVAFNAKNQSKQTDRSKVVTAKAAFVLAEETEKSFADIKLRLPLKKSLGKKQAALKKTVDAYQKVAAYGVAEYQSGSTFEIAMLYRDLAKDLLDSERPTELTDLQREQYDILLEEQAFPFEEKAAEILEINAQKTAGGYFDSWVGQSYEVLAELNPTQYLRSFKPTAYQALPVPAESSPSPSPLVPGDASEVQP